MRSGLFKKMLFTITGSLRKPKFCSIWNKNVSETIFIYLLGFKLAMEMRGFKMGPPKQPLSDAERFKYLHRIIIHSPCMSI